MRRGVCFDAPWLPILFTAYAIQLNVDFIISTKLSQISDLLYFIYLFICSFFLNAFQCKVLTLSEYIILFLHLFDLQYRRLISLLRNSNYSYGFSNYSSEFFFRFVENYTARLSAPFLI